METDNLLEQVKQDIDKNRLLERNDTIVAGISGGADSVCLLRVLKELRDPMGLTLVAVHVHHGLRDAEADGDQRFVEELCKDWDIPLRVFREDVRALSRERGISLEEAGREVRYRLFNEVLEETDAQHIAVAHQREDQAETVMLHILRGTGPDGLCGMSMRQGKIIRPLLNISRSQILEFLRQRNIGYRTDSTNQDSDYTRNRIRNILFPMLGEMFSINPADPLVRLSGIMREEKDYFDEAADKAYHAARVTARSTEEENAELSVSVLKNFHPALIRRIIRLAWEKINSNKKNLEQIHVEQVLDLCMNGRTGKRVLLPGKFEARLSYDRLIFSRTPEKREESYSYPVTPDGVTTALEAGGILYGTVLPADQAFGRYGIPEDSKENSLVQLFDYDKLKDGILLRNRLPGDRIHPVGLDGEKKLKDYFIDRKLPRGDRSRVPLIARGNRIVWVIGMRTSQEFRANVKTQTVLVLEWRELNKRGE